MKYFLTNQNIYQKLYYFLSYLVYILFCGFTTFVLCFRTKTLKLFHVIARTTLNAFKSDFAARLKYDVRE